MSSKSLSGVFADFLSEFRMERAKTKKVPSPDGNWLVMCEPDENVVFKKISETTTEYNVVKIEH